MKEPRQKKLDDSIYMKFKKRQNYNDTKKNSGYQGLRVVEVIAKGQKKNFWGDGITVFCVITMVIVIWDYTFV